MEELTKEEIDFVLERTDNLAIFAKSWSDSDVKRDYIENHKDKIINTVNGRTAIELGPGLNPFFIGEPCEYIGVEPFLFNVKALENILSRPQSNEHFDRLRKENKLKVVLDDAYSFLKEQPDSLAFVYSFGLFDVYNQIGGNTYGIKEGTIVDKYIQALANQIARVTPEDGITMHWGFDHADYFLKAGLVPLDFNMDSGKPNHWAVLYIKHKITPGTFLIHPFDSTKVIISTGENSQKIKCISRK